MLQLFLQVIEEGKDHGVLRYPKFLQHHDIALLAQDGLHKAFLDRFLTKSTATEVQIVAQNLDGLRSLHDRP
jgi:hypothetical protein